MRGKEKLKEITRPALKEIFKGKDKKSKDQVMYEAHLTVWLYLKRYSRIYWRALYCSKQSD